MQESNLKTPYKKVNHLGSAHNGTGLFLYQRLSAIALIILGIWFVYALLVQLPADYYHVMAWIKHPFNTFALLSLVIIMMYHTQLGLQVIIEDYVHHHAMRLISIILLKLTSLGIMILTTILLMNIQASHLPILTSLTVKGQF